MLPLLISIKKAYPEDEIDGSEGQTAGQTDRAAGSPRGRRLQPSALLHFTEAHGLRSLLEAHPCKSDTPSEGTSVEQIRREHPASSLFSAVSKACLY